METENKGKNKQDKKRKNQNWKDKRNKKRQKTNDKSEVKQDNDQEDQWNRYDKQSCNLGSPKFDEYYKKQLTMLNENEFEVFTKTLQEKLPVTFRINATEPNYQRLIEIFQDQQFIAKNLQDSDLQSNQSKEVVDYDKLKLECKKFYPLDVLYELTIPKELLKKDQGLKGIHKIIQVCSDSGAITRQEIVSMMPPLLLDIHAEHSVFDMCAAPGSKTAQILEMIRSSHIYQRNGKNVSQTQGFIVANDADYKRSYMLTHQMNRLNTSNVIILNHNAQNFPTLYYKNNISQGQENKVLYDRIVCDVPCSSDAAIRKIPMKWEKWNTGDGASLHPLQLRILIRGLQLLKVGGKLSYSTCSLNPIENEAVVAAALKQFQGYIQLEKVQIPGFKLREGLTNWHILNEKEDQSQSYFEEYENFEKVPEKLQKKFQKSMFVNAYEQDILQELKKCVRIFPHDQNTSGFFITIFKKLKDFDIDEEKQTLEEFKIQPKSEGKQTQLTNNYPKIIQEKQRNKNFDFFRCDPVDPDIQFIKAFYGLSEEFPVEQLITQTEEMKKLYFVSPQLSEYIHADSDRSQLNIINMGVILFMKNTSKFGGGECIFRIAQDGVLNIIPYMNKRLVYTSDEEAFKFFLRKKINEIEDISDEHLKKEIDNMTGGCFVIALKVQDDQIIEGLSMYKMQKQVSVMASREAVFSLHIRYLNKEEREEANKHFD